MECAAIGEMVDTGTEYSSDVWDSILVSLYGDIDLSEYDSEQPVDYDAAIQEQSLEPTP